MARRQQATRDRSEPGVMPGVIEAAKTEPISRIGKHRLDAIGRQTLAKVLLTDHVVRVGRRFAAHPARRPVHPGDKRTEHSTPRLILFAPFRGADPVAFSPRRFRWARTTLTPSRQTSLAGQPGAITDTARANEPVLLPPAKPPRHANASRSSSPAMAGNAAAGFICRKPLRAPGWPCSRCASRSRTTGRSWPWAVSVAIC